MKGIKMDTTYHNYPNPDEIFEGPTDEELQRIENELEKYSD